MSAVKTFDFEEYQFALLRKILLTWGLLAAVGFLMNSFWFTISVGRTLEQNLVIAVICAGAFICRRIVTRDNQVQVARIYTWISSFLLACTMFFSEDRYMVLVGGALAVHVVVSILILPPMRTTWLGYGIAFLYVAILTTRVTLFPAENEVWTFSHFLKVATFPGMVIVAVGAVMSSQVSVLQQALTRVKMLEGILPICSYCKKIRDEDGKWHTIESFIDRTTEAKFSHGICPDCYPAVMAEAESPHQRRKGDRRRLGVASLRPSPQQ